MNSEDQVRAALEALADHDRLFKARAPALEIYKRRPARKWNFGTISGAIGLAAAAVMAAFFMWPSQTIPMPRPPAPPQTAIVEPAPAVTAIQIAEVKAEPQRIRPVKRPVARKQPREVVTEFFALMDTPQPFERGQLLRVVVPASTMRTVGLPVNPDRLTERVQADVLVGEEGMARAIRFVSYEQ